MSLRAQPPVRSPLTLRALLAGLAAGLSGGDQAREAVGLRLAELLAPRALRLTDSGTSALGLALRLAARRRPGRPVLLPAWGCYDLATAADAADVRVLLYDLDPVTLGPDWDALAGLLRQEPAAVVAAHLYGLPADMPRLARLGEATGTIVISDAAQGAGAALDGRPLAAWGDLAVLSFGRGKGMTGGRGGALVVHRDDLADPVRELTLQRPRGGARELLALAAQWVFTRPLLYGIPAGIPQLGLGETVYHPPHAADGISAVAAGALEVTLGYAEGEAALRRSNAAWLLDHLDRRSLRMMSPIPGSSPGWLRFPVLISGGSDAGAEVTDSRILGIYRGYPLALADLPGFAQRVGNLAAPFSGARELARRLVTLPTHGAVGVAGLTRLVDWSRRL